METWQTIPKTWHTLTTWKREAPWDYGWLTPLEHSLSLVSNVPLEAAELLLGLTSRLCRGLLSGEDEAAIRRALGSLVPIADVADSHSTEPGAFPETLRLSAGPVSIDSLRGVRVRLGILATYSLREALGDGAPPPESTERLLGWLSAPDGALRRRDGVATLDADADRLVARRQLAWAQLAFGKSPARTLLQSTTNARELEATRAIQLQLQQSLDTGDASARAAAWKQYLESFPAEMVRPRTQATWVELLWAARCAKPQSAPEATLIAWLRSHVAPLLAPPRPPPHDALLAQVLANPRDLHARHALRDALPVDDPRRELLTLQLAAGSPTAADRKRQTRVIKEHWERLAGPLAPLLQGRSTFTNGFLSRAVLKKPADLFDAAPSLAEAIGHPWWSTIESFEGATGDASERESCWAATRFDEPILSGSPLPVLREIRTDLPLAALAHLPSLEQIDCVPRASDFTTLASETWPRLHSLQVLLTPQSHSATHPWTQSAAELGTGFVGWASRRPWRALSVEVVARSAVAWGEAPGPDPMVEAFVPVLSALLGAFLGGEQATLEFAARHGNGWQPAEARVTVKRGARATSARLAATVPAHRSEQAPSVALNLGRLFDVAAPLLGDAAWELDLRGVPTPADAAAFKGLVSRLRARRAKVVLAKR